ncbi:PQQ-dependent sugar dehydrogenase [Haloarculaceae archaeon H-GB1-1]|nr:PQQ-dependent sugar dehydrogenase [Haloarculaceae archaeon H-GB1-1]
MDPPPTTRRRFVVRGLSFASVGLAGCTQQAQSDAEQGTESPTTETGQQSPEPTSPISALGVERLGEGFTSPVGLEMPDESRRFVVDQVGVVHLLDDDGVADDPYLDLRDRVVDVSGFSERGLLGLALHPDFAENGRLFVRYSSRSRPGTPTDYSHTFVLSEFTADPNARTVDRATERVVLTIPQPQSNHNAGSVAFGPDGYLYVGVGDGGAGGDQGTGHVEDWYEGNAGGNGQDVTRNLLGSVLRIDVDGRDDGKAYAVPEDNPLVGTDGLPEHYAWGFRNPWRLSFGPDGRLFVADVGQSEWEEVDIVEQGGNYGWNVREGSHCFRANECPDETPDGNPLRPPAMEYPHSGDGPTGISVIGGYLYNGTAIPALRNRYVFADWRANGSLFVAREPDEGLWPIREVPVRGDVGQFVLSFGQDADGELYVCTSNQGGVSGSSGAVFRLTSSE